MNRLLFIVLTGFVAAGLGWAQPDTTATPFTRKYADQAGKVAYYFWEETPDGTIDSGKVIQPYAANESVFFCPKSAGGADKRLTGMVKWVSTVLSDPRWHPANSYFFYRRKHRKDWQIIRTMHRDSAAKPASVLYIRAGGGWKSKQAQAVVYFSAAAGGLRYTHTSDSLMIPEWKLALPANGHYRVIRYLHGGQPDSLVVLNSAGQDIATEIRAGSANTPRRFLILINGYRGPKTDDDPGDGLLTAKDRFYYWFKIDNRFEELVKPDKLYYVDGSFPVATSVHRTRFRFLKSWISTKLTPKKQAAPRVYKRLNTRSNPEGFALRREAGRLAGEVFLLARNQFPHAPEVQDTVDIVSHSMGYAYALGFMDAIVQHAVIRTNYIIAPENATEGGFDWSTTGFVWQYGSNLGLPDADPLREQDGIAPQFAVKGIEQLPPGKGARLFVPKDWPHKNFVDVHMIYSYDWIFDRIPKGMPGYVGP